MREQLDCVEAVAAGVQQLRLMSTPRRPRVITRTLRPHSTSLVFATGSYATASAAKTRR